MRYHTFLTHINCDTGKNNITKRLYLFLTQQHKTSDVHEVSRKFLLYVLIPACVCLCVCVRVFRVYNEKVRGDNTCGERAGEVRTDKKKIGF